MRGNIIIGTQSTGDSRFFNPTDCNYYYNTFLPFIEASQADSTAFNGPRLNFTSVDGGTNRAFGNIICGFSGGPVPFPAGAAYDHCVVVDGSYGTVSGVVASDNISTGHASRYATNGSGVITTWPPGTAAGAVSGTAASARLDDIFSGDNAAGDFVGIADFAVLVQTSAHQTAVGRKLGALSEGGGYVTFAAGHIDDPQDAVLDHEMEPA
jgi:hypothetical protein